MINPWVMTEADRLREGGLSLFEARFGRRLSEAEEEYLYREGHDDGADRMRMKWWICNRCGEPLISDLHHECKRIPNRIFKVGGRGDSPACSPGDFADLKALEDG